MREIDQESSGYALTPPPAFEPTNEASTTAWEPLFKRPDTVGAKFNSVISSFHRLLDSLSGRQSYHFKLPASPYVIFDEIFSYLKSEKIIDRIIWGADRYNDAPAFSRLGIVPAFSSALTDGMIPQKAIGHGFGKTQFETFSKAIGELLERYILALYQRKNLTRSSTATLKRKKAAFLNPASVAGFSELQRLENPYRNFTEESMFTWEMCQRISTGEAILIPAQLAHWNYNFIEGEPFLQDTNTNGAGGHFTKEGAILSGLYELIQRDAFLIHWLNTITPPRIEPESIDDPKFLSLLAESRRYGFEIHCMNITLDLKVPTMAVIIEDTSGKGPCFSLGASTQSNPKAALYRAFEEAWSVYYWMRPLPPYELPKSYRPFSNHAVKQEERLRLAANPTMANQYRFFMAGEMKPLSQCSFEYPHTFADIKEELTHAVSLMESTGPGYEVYAYLPTHPILETLGYHTAQVIVPEIIPLYLQESAAPLGSRRLKDVPAKLNLKGSNHLNPFPHPFP